MVEFKSLAFRGWYGFRKILNEEQESTVPFSVIYSQTLLSVQEIWKMFPYSKKTIISVETTFPTHRTWVKYTGSRHRKLSFLLVSWSSLPNIVLKSQNSQITLLFRSFSLGLSHLHENTLDPFSNYYSNNEQSIVFSFIERTALTSTLKLSVTHF